MAKSKPVLLSENKRNYVFSQPVAKKNGKIKKPIQYEIIYVGSLETFSRLLLRNGFSRYKRGRGKAELRYDGNAIPAIEWGAYLIPDFVKVEEIKDRKLIKRIDQAALGFAQALIAMHGSKIDYTIINDIEYQNWISYFRQFDEDWNLGFGEVGIVSMTYLVAELCSDITPFDRLEILTRDLK